MNLDEDRLRELDNQILDDAANLKEEVQELPEELQNFILLLKELESSYSEIMNNPLNSDDELMDSISNIREIIQELEDIEETLEDTLNTTTSLKEDFSDELDILSEAR
jgi:methyl-accepting chemotaxis protein